MENKKFINAIQIICNELEKDKELYYAWQSAIAMSFYDNYRLKKKQVFQRNLKLIDIHEISNEAAKAFLNLLKRSNKCHK